jgi:type I restriction enzyme S subunit
MRKDWTETTLGEIAEWFSGGTPKAGKPEFYEGGDIPWVVIADLMKTEIYETATCITAAGLSQIGGRLAPVGSVLISMYATVGRPGIAHVPVATNQAIAWSVPNPKLIESRFLLLVAQSLEVEISSMARGATQRNINRAMLREFMFLLPPLIEQKRIVDVVASVDAYIDALQQQADSARVARNSIAENVVNADFPKTQLLALGRLVTGSTPSTKKPKFWKPEEVMFLTPGDFGHQLLIAETARKVSNEGAVAGRILQPNSVVQVCIGATIGKVGIIEQSLITNQQINALEGLSKNDAYFAALMLSTHRMKSELIDISGKTTMPIISKSTWGSLEIPWPNDKVRQAVSEVASSIDEYEKQLNTVITATKKLRFGLLSDLLSGNHEIPASYDSLLGAA